MARGHTATRQSRRCPRVRCLAWFRVLFDRPRHDLSAGGFLPLTQTPPKLSDVAAAGFQKASAHLMDFRHHRIRVKRLSQHQKTPRA